MSPAFPELAPGRKVSHSELGDGVVVSAEAGYAAVFFREHGERRVPAEFLRLSADAFDRIVFGGKPSPSPDGEKEAAERLWLALEAEELPLLESAAALTSAKVDLLPHQIVLVHRITNARPRRFLIADEVGLGKTIETALILRELASRGELSRALMVVPAGLVENWRRELNDVFHLDFEVFGGEGDVTDRKTNAFAKHNRLIASIDTLKRPARIKRLLEAPPWDLAVFDEAHHLSVYRTGRKVARTENFKLAEALRDHCRDLLLLSATPHQGDHFRFWTLIRLLNPELFLNEKDMVANRHRLNAVVIRRTKADACAQDGGPLFARRMVSTEAFALSDPEKRFYAAILEYLRDGYDLAAAQGSQGRALGFVMTVFQKIAASSFAAIRSTLRRRLLMLTIQEGVDRDERLDVDARDGLFAEARQIIHEIHGLSFDAIGNAQADQLFADAKYQLLKKRGDALAYLKSAESGSDSERRSGEGEESAALLVASALPEERKRLRELLALYPPGIESKTSMLARAVREIWRQNPEEKIVVFATYLGTVEAIRRQLDGVFPEAGVEVLKGGDHGSKTAAQKRFKRKDGPKVLVSTAAGREGINLQFAHVLFNYDLPWNPMDLEQRIGRIHRYGQESTSQVYNLVSRDTIEGQIYLLLEEKLRDIAKALGKLDEHGQVAEDLREQVLGQLGGSISFARLYQDGVSDPTLKRTRQELDIAVTNANLARRVVFELFQDLDRFNLGDYRRFDDQGQGMRRLVHFVTRAAKFSGSVFQPAGERRWRWKTPGGASAEFTTERGAAVQDENLQLLGLEHPMVCKLLGECLALPAENRFVGGKIAGLPAGGLLTVWKIETRGKGGQTGFQVARVGVDEHGERAPRLEKLRDELLSIKPDNAVRAFWKSKAAGYKTRIQELLHRELSHSGIIDDETAYSAVPLAAAGLDAG
ncbi:MAG: DEAD/DEAH box helicase [Planctomycetota bacterium]|jgi:superfamily II DNA or RNA helicase|nr:DEAD/DEAH box helicase [Planctomycetota bacterium]